MSPSTSTPAHATIAPVSTARRAESLTCSYPASPRSRCSRRGRWPARWSSAVLRARLRFSRPSSERITCPPCDAECSSACLGSRGVALRSRQAHMARRHIFCIRRTRLPGSGHAYDAISSTVSCRSPTRACSCVRAYKVPRSGTLVLLATCRRLPQPCSPAPRRCRQLRLQSRNCAVSLLR